MDVSGTGANDRESLAGDPARAHCDAAHESEQERQQTCGQLPAVRAVRLHFRLHPYIRAAVDGGRTRAAETNRIGTLRRVAPSSRVKPRPRRCPCGGGLALGSNDRRSGSSSWSDPRPRWSGRMRRPADLPGDRGRIGTRSDPDPGRRRRRSGVALRGGRLDRRDRRRRLLRLRCRRRVGGRDLRRCGRGRGYRWGSRGRGPRCGRRLGRRRRAGGAPRRKKSERVDVRLGGADADAEVHVWHRVLRLPRRSGPREQVTLRDRLAPTNLQLAEVSQRRFILTGRDRHGEAVDRCRPGECDRAVDGRARARRAAQGDVDAAVLPTRVRVAAHREPAQHRAVGGPRPGPRRRARHQRAGGDEPEASEQLRCLREHGANVARACATGNTELPSCYRELR